MPMLLGMLNEKPASGYSLHKRIFMAVKPALTHIYRTLQEMDARGLVTFEWVSSDKTPDRKVYTITELGIAEFKRWLRRPVVPVIPYDPFVQQLLFSADLDREEVIDNIVKYIKKIKQIRNGLDKTERNRVNKLDEILQKPNTSFYRNIGLNCLIAHYDGWIEWADETVRMLSQYSQYNNDNKDIEIKTKKDKELRKESNNRGTKKPIKKQKI